MQHILRSTIILIFSRMDRKEQGKQGKGAKVSKRKEPPEARSAWESFLGHLAVVDGDPVL